MKARMIFMSSLDPRIFNMLLNHSEDSGVRIKIQRKSSAHIRGVCDGFRLFDTFNSDDLVDPLTDAIGVGTTNMKSRRLSIYEGDVVVMVRLIKKFFPGGPKLYEDGDRLEFYTLDVI